MKTPCTIRSRVKVPSPGATASSAVGIASRARLTRMPSRRSMRRENSATSRPDTAMPMVLALTAKPMAAGLTW